MPTRRRRPRTTARRPNLSTLIRALRALPLDELDAEIARVEGTRPRDDAYLAAALRTRALRHGQTRAFA